MRPIAIRAVLGMNHHRFAIACALYAGEILGLEISGLNVENITGNGFNIYNDPALNGALGGLTYALAGGGSLMPVPPVPISGAAWLLGSGLLG